MIGTDYVAAVRMKDGFLCTEGTSSGDGGGGCSGGGKFRLTIVGCDGVEGLGAGSTGLRLKLR